MSLRWFIDSDLNLKQEEKDMYSRVATAYDQNPARMQIVARRRKTSSKPLLQAFIGIQLLVGLVAVYFWNYLAV